MANSVTAPGTYPIPGGSGSRFIVRCIDAPDSKGNGTLPRKITAAATTLAVGPRNGRWESRVREHDRRAKEWGVSPLQAGQIMPEAFIGPTVLLRPGESVTVFTDCEVSQPDGRAATVVISAGAWPT